MKLLKKFDLTKKTVLITGAAGLLGREHAAAMLESGATIVITDLKMQSINRLKDELEDSNTQGRILVRDMDVRSTESINETCQSLYSEGVRVDVLINNAAIDPKVQEDYGLKELSRLENFALEQWNLQIAVGLTGAFLCSQVFGSRMAGDGLGGVILNIASDLSILAPDQRLYKRDGVASNLQPVKPVSYSVIKAGLVGLTKYLSTYWADKGVRANALSPGGVYNGQADEFVSRITSLIPMGRMATSDEYRAAVQFLCSEASAYMNGQNIVMDGGRSAW